MQNPQFIVAVNGQEIEVSDISSVAENAALADDRVFSELLRLSPGATPTARAIIPYGIQQKDSDGAHEQNAGVVKSNSSPNATVLVRPFRAVIGTRSLGVEAEKHWYKDVRSAVFTGPGGSGNSLQIPATISNSRKDLIYARVDVDVQSSDFRYVKAVDGSEGVMNLGKERNTTVTIGRAQGDEGPVPMPGVIPPDTATTFYIPLAHVLLTHPHTLTSTISPQQIGEIAPCLGVAPSAGGVDARPATAFSSASYAASNWTPGSGRPDSFLPTTMFGKAERFFALDFTGGKTPLPLNTQFVLDNSLDWRRRVFKTDIIGSATSGVCLAWKPGGGTTFPVPGAASTPVRQLGQSFANDYGSSVPNCSGHVALLNPTPVPAMASGSAIDIYVHATTGALMANTLNVNPNCMLFLWIESSGAFPNAL